MTTVLTMVVLPTVCWIFRVLPIVIVPAERR